MTLPRTIHRRDARKRAKARKRAPKGPSFLAVEWVTRDALNALEATSLAMAMAFSRQTDRNYGR